MDPLPVETQSSEQKKTVLDENENRFDFQQMPVQSMKTFPTIQQVELLVDVERQFVFLTCLGLVFDDDPACSTNSYSLSDQENEFFDADDQIE